MITQDEIEPLFAELDAQYFDGRLSRDGWLVWAIPVEWDEASLEMAKLYRDCGIEAARNRRIEGLSVAELPKAECDQRTKTIKMRAPALADMAGTRLYMLHEMAHALGEPVKIPSNALSNADTATLPIADHVLIEVLTHGKEWLQIIESLIARSEDGLKPQARYYTLLGESLRLEMRLLETEAAGADTSELKRMLGPVLRDMKRSADEIEGNHHG